MADNKQIIASSLKGAPHLEALEKVIRERMDSIPVKNELVYLIDLVEAGALPFLADQFNISGIKGFAMAETEDERRAIIKKAIDLNRFKGTPYSIKEIIKAAGYEDAHIIEGVFSYYSGSIFYDGTTRHYGEEKNWALFQVIVFELEGKELNDDRVTELNRFIKTFKNARSTLYSVNAGIDLVDWYDGETFESFAIMEKDDDSFMLIGYGNAFFVGESVETLNILGEEYSLETAILEY